MTASMPGFCSPMPTSRPAGTSAVRGASCPARGRRVVPRVTSPPSRARSTASATSTPYPNGPDAAITGVWSTSPRPSSTSSETGRPPRTSVLASGRSIGRRRRGGSDRRPGTDRRPDRAHRRRALDRRPGHDPPPRLHGTSAQASSSDGEGRPLAADPLRDAAGARDRAPEARPRRAADRLAGRDLEERLAPRLGRARRHRSAAAALAPERRDAQPAATPDRERGERARAATANPAANDWSAHAS